MARKRTGLRNKFRTGRGWYSKNQKGKNADRYGSYQQGYQRTPELVAGTRIDEQLPALGRGH